MFSQDYYPDYVIRTVPHKPWLQKLIRLPQLRQEEVTRIMKEQMESGKYKPSCASYRSTFFVVKKKGGALWIVHDLQPLNAVMIRDVTLPPVMTCTSKSGSGTWQNPTGDDRVSSMHKRGSRVKVASSTTVLAHRFPPPSLSGC